MRSRWVLRILYRVETRFEDLFLTIDDRVVGLVVEAKAKVRVLLLSVSGDFDDFFIDTRETDILGAEGCDLIGILIWVTYCIDDIELKSIDSTETSRLLLRIFSFEDDIEETYRASLRRLSRYFEIFLLL